MSARTVTRVRSSGASSEIPRAMASKNWVTPNPIMNDQELQTLIFSHYENEAQTLTTGAEANLLKFREQAQYADGRETDLTGAEAYARKACPDSGHYESAGWNPSAAVGACCGPFLDAQTSNN